MNELFQDMIGQGILIYLDNIIVYAETEQEHWDLLAEVLHRLREADFFCKPEKCYFGKKELDYLGFVVNQLGMQMDPYKVKVVQEWPALSSKQDIQKFIAFANFYQKFIENFTKIARPLTELMSSKKTFTWRERQQESFRKLKEAFTTAPMLV
ncbi:DNA/RNA polymerase [Sanghuangporus baumii]|uniref:DNA/RNA polymerase n=1 Tax=Sanghuangporus baumii TaxID=108892 RepID=A0A9Q5I5K2_SANBA|nr:DNA/RNA polymerase [Sanghuangporus baumii]